MANQNYLPAVSVVMATYNGSLYLEQQLDSILSQTLTPSEILICDDNSTDNTTEILEKYRIKGHLKYVVNETQLGLVANFKKAVSLASGQNYVALSDQDDIWLPEKLEITAKKLQSIDDGLCPSIVYSDLILIDKNGNILNQSFRNELGQDSYKHSLKTLVFGNFVNGCTVLMNHRMKEFFATIPDRVILNHDAWIALIAFSFGKVDIVSESLIKYRKHEDNVTEVSVLKKKNRYQRIKSQLEPIWTNKTPYLLDQLKLVRQFYEAFKTNFSDEDKRILEEFLRLEKSSFLQKKLTMRKFFLREWLKIINFYCF